jgi:hypothetical protein
MRSFKLFLLAACFIVNSQPAIAWDDNYGTYGGHQGSQQQYDLNSQINDEPYDNRGNPQYRYEGASGKKYQYDLSDPGDQIEYELDLDAQIRDEINPDPSIDLDRGMGQVGGGAE